MAGAAAGRRATGCGAGKPFRGHPRRHGPDPGRPGPAQRRADRPLSGPCPHLRQRRHQLGQRAGPQHRGSGRRPAGPVRRLQLHGPGPPARPADAVPDGQVFRLAAGLLVLGGQAHAREAGLSMSDAGGVTGVSEVSWEAPRKLAVLRGGISELLESGGSCLGRGRLLPDHADRCAAPPAGHGAAAGAFSGHPGPRL